MQPLTRRGVALLATTAALGAGSLTTVAQAASAATVSNNAVRTDRDLDIITQALGLLNSLVPLQTVIALLNLNNAQLGGLLSAANASQLTSILTGPSALNLSQLTGALTSLSPSALGDLLAPLSGGNLTAVLGAASNGQLNGALATLTPTELTGVLGRLDLAHITGLLGAATPAQLTGLLGVLGQNPAQLTSVLGLLTNATQLTSVVGALTPAQITSLLGQAGAPTSLVSGLTGRATQVAAAPNVTDINGLLAQVQALLGGGLPAVPGLSGLLNAVQPLLGVAGVDTSLLTGLLGTLNTTAGATLPEPLASAVQGLIGSAQTAIAASGVAPGTTTTPGATTPKATPKPGTGAAPAQSVFKAYRATVGSVKVAKNRKTATMSVSCPATAPKGCLVTLDGVVAGKKAFAQKVFVVLRNVKQTMTVKLTSAAASRLKKKGGSLKVSAHTVNGSLSSISKTVKVAKPLKKAARKR